MVKVNNKERVQLTPKAIAELEKVGVQEGGKVGRKGFSLDPSGSLVRPKKPSIIKPQPSPTDTEAGLLVKNQGVTDETTEAIVGTDAIVQDERVTTKAVSKLNVPENNFTVARDAHDASVKILEDRRDALEKRRQEEIEGIRVSAAETKKATEGEQERETGAFASTIARIGGFLGPSASATGAIRNLSNEHKAELASLDAKRDAAITKANQAIDDKQFDLARATVEEIQDFEQTIEKRRQDFFDNVLSIEKEERQQDEFRQSVNNQIRDDARQAVTTLLSNFGGIDFASLDPATSEQLQEMAALAGLAPELLVGPTIKEKGAEATERQRQISNAISEANLGLRNASFQLSLAKFEEAEKLDALEAQRLGLPRSLVGTSEDDVFEDLQQAVPPDWYLELQTDITESDTEELTKRWTVFKNEILTTSAPLFNFGGIGLPTPIK